ncbi:MAG TPA: hypothetical protein ENJ09_06815 [Planctomycetes bacterium]|nr:hypothetical protein [Planctomycetota bacterium]
MVSGASDPTEARRRRLEAFSAGSLDWPAVREVLEGFAHSAIGRRALAELVPRDDEGARLALLRARELLVLQRSGQVPALAGAPDPVPVLAAAVTFTRSMDGEGLAAIANFLRLVEDLGAWVRARGDRALACGALFGGLADLSGLRAALEGTVDRKGRVVDDASPRLAELRRAIRDLERELDAMLRDLASRPGLRNALAEGHAGQIHRRAGRRVLAVRQRHAGQVPGIVHDRSQSGETIFVEPRDSVELANRLTAAEADAAREVGRLLAERTREVLDARDAIGEAAKSVAELELAAIAAGYALATGGAPARLPGESGAGEGLVLRAWRHPLLVDEEKRGRLDAVVPIDLRLGGEFRMLVITGPNTGGKTLALKGAGLAALMTRLGLSIPAAEGTTVPLYDGVAADIGDEQEIQQSLSTFSSHLVRIRAGLERAGERTLVLLDELGGGTDPSEGAALGEAVLERLLESGAHTLASTHLGQLKAFAFHHGAAENAHVEFDVDTLAPLYRVVIGAPGESRALEIARRIGFDEGVLDRARARCVRGDGEARELMGRMRDVRVEAERLRAEAEARVVELEARERELDAKRREIEGRGTRLEGEAQRVLEERLRGARDWLAKLEGLLPRLERGARTALEPMLGGLADALAEAGLTERRRSFLSSLKKGQTVWLPGFKKRVTITRVRREKRELGVRLGKHEMTVSFEDVTFYEGG